MIATEPARRLLDGVEALRTGLVGIGKMGISHLALTRAHPDLDVTAVCDSQGFMLSTITANTGINGYKAVERMLDSEQLDCLFVATPTSSHYDVGLLAIERGLNVFIEKPLTLSYEQSAELARRATDAQVANQVGYHNRFIGTFQEAARLVRAGAIGRVHHVDGQAFGAVVTKRAGGGRTWRAVKSEGGGCLHDYACHVIDLMNFVAGRPSKVTDAQLSSVYSANVEDAVYALFRYPDGATGSLETNWSDSSFRKMTTTITVHGSEGKIFADRQECRLFLRDGSSFEDFESGWTVRYITELQAPVDFYLRGEEYSAQIDAFAAAARARDAGAVNSFASAADTDWVVAQILDPDHGHQDGGGGSPTMTTDGATTLPSLRRQLVDAARHGAQRLRSQVHALRERLR